MQQTCAPASLANKSQNTLLLVGGIFSLAFALFQVSAIWWPLSVIEYFTGPVQLSVEKPRMYAVLCLVVAALMAVAGLYSLLGANTLRRLPLLRSVLIAVTVVYLLRGLFIVPQWLIVDRHPEMFRILVFSLISLAVGLIHMVGVVRLCRSERAA